MKILGYEIIVRKINDPLNGLRADDVELLASKDGGYSYGGTFRKIARIKAVRKLRPETRLAVAKIWVESHFGT